MGWRKWNKIVHRDLGYLCFGLTIIYVISGIAVNHIDLWNPSYRIQKINSQLIRSIPSEQPDKKTIDEILKDLAVKGEFKNIFRPDRNTLQIFTEGNTLSINLTTGEVTQDKVTPRPLLYPMNFLHLNHPKKLWSWFADLYALSLGLVAFTGLFMLKGKKGISGRGAWLTGTGIVLPLFFLWIYL